MRKGPILSLVATVSVFLLLIVLSNIARGPNAAPDVLLKAERDRQSTEALRRLRDTLNSGRCGQVYDEASAAFRELESRDEWLAECEAARRTLGLWTAGGTSTTAGPGFVMRVDGTAVFTRGQAHFSAGWTVEDGRPRLFRFYLEGHIAVPPLNRPMLWHLDPPIPSRHS